MIRHGKQFAKYRRDLSRIRAVKQRVCYLLKDMQLQERGLLSSFDQQIEEISHELSQFERSHFAIDIDRLNLLTNLAGALISARLALGWTQAELAKRSGLARKTISKHESENYESIQLSAARKIARAICEACAKTQTG